MLAWVPMASMVTIQPSSARVASSSGIAVFSFDFAAVARCPITTPAPAAKALTRCSGVASTLPERRLVLPSMATTASVSRAGRIPLTQCRNAASNSSGSIRPNRRPKVSCDGIPASSLRYPRSQSSFSFAQSSISTKVSAPTRTALTATTSNSTRSCSIFPACLGSVIDTNTSAKRNRFPVSMDYPKKTENYTNQPPVNSPRVTH